MADSSRGRRSTQNRILYPRRRVIRMSKDAVWFDERPADFPKEYEQHIQRRPL